MFFRSQYENSDEKADRTRVRSITAWAQAVRTQEESLRTHTLSDLANQLDQLRYQSDYQTAFTQAASIVAAAVLKVRGFKLHDVQIAGAGSAASGSIIEMQTGEGKTIVCAMAALLRSVFDTSVHVATTNDYLAERDYAENVPLFEALGKSTGLLKFGAPESDTRAAYRSAITYGPGYLFGFDYLRDQVKIRNAERVVLGREVLESINGTDFRDRLTQTDHQSIIVDEADSVLLDEASTPLILSEPHPFYPPELLEPFVTACEVASEFVEDQHFEANRATRRIKLTKAGEQLCHDSLQLANSMQLERIWSAYIENALFAKELLLRDEHYVVDGEDIKLVDQFTGRILDDRQLRNGLHQAVEAKEMLPVKPSNRTTARLTRQTFFSLYDRVCGMTGTISGNEAEIDHFYKAQVAAFSPNLPSKRRAIPTRFFATVAAKLSALAKDIVERNANGQPILVGTRTIWESQLVSKCLRDAGVEHLVLNGVQDEAEADIVASAGIVGAVTIATNMAGRGTDIKLSPSSRRLGGLHVVCTQHHTSERVDRQLIGRCARQGDPGSFQFWISAEDDLFQCHATRLARRMSLAASADQEVYQDFSAEILRLQQRLAAEQYQMRRSLVRQDHQLDFIRETMLQA